VLGYVDSPFKLFAILIMGVVAFSGYFLWQNQEFMFDAYKESKKLPEINTSRADEASAMLFKKTGATVVAIFKVNPLFGSRVLYKAYTKEAGIRVLKDIDVGLFSQNAANNADVIKLMTNEIPCSSTATRSLRSDFGTWRRV
jgi:NADH:ubiquinone oxidoreductase subunit 4 (subunit M)